MSIDILYAIDGDFQMNAGKVLITGATGDTGGYAIERLLELGREVRALGPHAGREVGETSADAGSRSRTATSSTSGRSAPLSKGAKRGLLRLPHPRPGILQATAYFAQAANEAGVEGIVNMSQKSAREDAKSHAATDHWLSERVFDRSGAERRPHPARPTSPSG